MSTFWPWLLSGNGRVTIEITVSLILALVAIGWWLKQSRKWRLSDRPFVLILLIAALLSAAAYTRFGRFRGASIVNGHDVYHYFLGAKYHKELGYSNLYICTLLADLESEQAFRDVPRLRDLETLKHVPRLSCLTEASCVLASFSPERWRSFKADVAWMTSLTPSRTQLVNDMGHNATPFWNVLMEWILKTVPTGSTRSLEWICALDYVLIGIMLAVIGRTLGILTMLTCAGFLGVNYATEAMTIQGSLLRLDWLAAMVTGACLLRKGHYAWSAPFWAYAVLVRLFPLMFLYGMAAKLVWSIITRQSLPRQLLSFWASFALAVGGFVLLTVWDAGGLGSWKEFSNKISIHKSHVTGRRWGWSHALLDKQKQSINGLRAHQSAREGWPTMVVTALVLLAAAAVAVRCRDVDTLVLGVPLLFFLTSVTWYYYVVLLVPVVVFSAQLQEWRYLCGLVLLCLFNVIAYKIDASFVQPIACNSRISTVLMFVVVMLLLLLWCGKARPVPTRAVSGTS